MLLLKIFFFHKVLFGLNVQYLLQNTVILFIKTMREGFNRRSCTKHITVDGGNIKKAAKWFQRNVKLAFCTGHVVMPYLKSIE